MNEEQMRKDFQEWCTNHKISTSKTKNGYVNEFAKIAYIAWKASRESLIVELPDPFSLCDGYGGEGVHLEDMKEALESQGIKWK